MATYQLMKMKRKDLDDVNDEFSDFSLSSPARKIRRLDAELPPIIEEDETEMPLELEHGVSRGMEEHLQPPVIEELPTVPDSEERAIVLFKPVNNTFPQSPSSFSVDPHVISELKNKGMWSTGSGPIVQLADESDDNKSKDASESSKCLAVIPWIPSKQLHQTHEPDAGQGMVSESMDTDEMVGATMEIEDSVPHSSLGQQRPFEDNGMMMLGNEGVQHQWQQPHCMFPQPLENTTTPIVWYR